MEISNRLKSAKLWLGLFWLGGTLFSSACAHHDDSADDSSSQEQHRHHGGGGSGGGGGRYGHGQGGMFDQSNPSSSPSPVPGE
jgi:hypothetical protein